MRHLVASSRWLRVLFLFPLAAHAQEASPQVAVDRLTNNNAGAARAGFFTLAFDHPGDGNVTLSV